MMKKTGGWKGKSAWSIADNFAQQAISFLIFAVLARWLTPHEFGLLAIAHLMVQFVRFSLLDALALPVVRAPTVDDRLFNWLFTFCTLTGLTAAALMALLAVPLAHFFKAPELAWVLVGMSGSIVLLGLVRAHEARLLREGNFRLLAIRSLCSVIAGGAVSLALAYRGAGAMALVAQQLTTTGLALLIAVAAEWRIWRPRWHWSTRQLRESAAEMGHVSGSAVLNYANGNGDAALVSVLLGPHATGLYNLGKRVLSAAYLVIGVSLNRVGVSLFVQNQGDPAELRRHYTRMLSITFLLLAPVYLLASALAEPLVVIAFGPQWRESAPVFAWLSVAYLAQAAYGLGQNLSFATQHAARVPKLAFIQLVVTTGLAVVFARWGTLGVAGAFAAGALAGSLSMQWLVNRQLGISASRMVSTMLPAACGSALAYAVVTLLPRTGLLVTGWWSLTATSAAGATAYLAAAGGSYWLLNRKR